MQAGSGDRVGRRLAAILAADVVGYSRLMEADETGTARLLREHRAAADPLVAEHGGRIVKTTGDGVLIEFRSVVGAVQFAVALQKLMEERNAGIASEHRMDWRVGIHLGDILIDGEDILGDGVNLAARLEGIAEPGGICISDDAFRQVRGKIDTEFLDIGEQALKNIARPIRVFSARLDGKAIAVPVDKQQDKPLISNRMPHSLCFIDDDVDELNRFKNILGDYFNIGVGTTLNKALDDLYLTSGSKKVDLFVLDMYFPREGNNTPEELERLGKAWDNFRKADTEFKVCLSELGQDFEGGRNLAKEVLRLSRVKKTPFVFFTRKGNLLDAITAYEEVGAIAVIKKPDPRTLFDETNRKKAYDDAMLQNKDYLIRTIERAIRQRGFIRRYGSLIITFFIGMGSSVGVWFLTKIIG